MKCPGWAFILKKFLAMPRFPVPTRIIIAITNVRPFLFVPNSFGLLLKFFPFHIRIEEPKKMEWKFQRKGGSKGWWASLLNYFSW